MNHPDYLEFLCWVNRILFPVDLVEELVELGMDERTAVYYEVEWKMQVDNGRPLDILRLYQSYCVGREPKVYDTTDITHYLQLWIDKRYQQWLSYKEIKS